MIKEQRVPKSEIAPRFGRWIHVEGGDSLLQVRSDLPLFVQNAILAHEMGHELDKLAGDFVVDGMFRNEMDANWYAIKQGHLLGLMAAAIMSLAMPSRIAYYIKRLKTGGPNGEST
jgi:hypothetical protein